MSDEASGDRVTLASSPPEPRKTIAIGTIFLILNIATLLGNALLFHKLVSAHEQMQERLLKMSRAYDSATATVVQRLADPKAELKVKFIVDSHLPNDHESEPHERSFKIFNTD